MKTQSLNTSLRALAIGLFAVWVLQGEAAVTGKIEAEQIIFEGGKPTAAKGTGTLKNEKDEIVASGKLIIGDDTMSLSGKKDAVFSYAASAAKSSPTNWPTKAPTQVALVEFDGKDKWTLKDDQFLFRLECDSQFHAKVLLDDSLLSSTRIRFPEGTLSIWGFSITVGAGGGNVVFKQGRPVDGDNTAIETPEKKKLEFPHKTEK